MFWLVVAFQTAVGWVFNSRMNQQHPHNLGSGGDTWRGVPLDFDSADSGQYIVTAFSLVPQAEDHVMQAQLVKNGMPPAHNPLRYTTSFFVQREYVRDENNSSCVGWANVIEACAVVIDCIDVTEHRGPWWINTPTAANYIVETVEVDTDRLYCHSRSQLRPLHLVPVEEARTYLQYISYAVSASMKTIPSFSFPLRFAGNTAEWWAKMHDMKPASHWMSMMGAVIREAARQQNGTWLEFGVGSGKTTTRIVSLMEHFGITEVLHGFDSFHGIPEKWNNLDVHTFTMEGEPPAFLLGQENVVLHQGWFNETLRDLDDIEPAAVAFLHIDVDLYSSCRDVLQKLKCRLLPGTVIVFDELFNYPMWEHDGEFRCLREFQTIYGLEVQYFGVFFCQSVPLFVTREVDPTFCT